MKFVSTRGQAPAASFREALFAGPAPDGGLYMPERLTPLPVEQMRGATLSYVAERIAAVFVGREMPRTAIQRVLDDALSFPIPLVKIDDTTSVLELFHGPTHAFKDVGARVMARLMAHFNDADTPFTVLAATSGDTGSAVAQAFHGVDGTRVIVLFPKDLVSPVQDAQFTTLGGNVTAVAVEGTFDDCQRLVRLAFAEPELREAARLTSANSINIGRLLPQTFYYVHAALQVAVDAPAVFSVPSGNFGNLTAGLLARRMGAPIAQFVAATTINDTVPRYLNTGRYEPAPSVPTLANSMDVGEPSNVERMRWLFSDNIALMRAVVAPSVHTDAEVRAAIAHLYQQYQYVCDPHSAIAYLGTEGSLRARGTSAQAGGAPGTSGASGSTHPFSSLATPGALGPPSPQVFLATAHPAKFREVVEPVIGTTVPLPPALSDALTRPRMVEQIAPDLDQLRQVLAHTT